MLSSSVSCTPRCRWDIGLPIRSGYHHYPHNYRSQRSCHHLPAPISMGEAGQSSPPLPASALQSVCSITLRSRRRSHTSWICPALVVTLPSLVHHKRGRVLSCVCWSPHFCSPILPRLYRSIVLIWVVASYVSLSMHPMLVRSVARPSAIKYGARCARCAK